MLELPPLSLSTGPAISGSSPNESGQAATGDFIVNKSRQKTGLMAAAAVALPLVTLGGVVWLLMKKR